MLEEEYSPGKEVSPGMHASAQLSAWELYAQDKGGKPDFPHPKGEAAAGIACNKRNKERARLGREPQPC